MAITRLDIVGRFESLSRLGQLTVGLESNQALARRPWVATFIVALPSAPQGVDQGQMPQAGRGLIIIQGIEQGKAISADALGVGVALGRLARQAAVLDALAIAFVPRQRDHALKPLGGFAGHLIEGGAQRFADELQGG